MIAKTLWGKLADGREVHQYSLTSKSKARVSIVNFGARITSLLVPDRQGKFQDVVLGYDSLPGYTGDKAYLGAIVGRCGNRIGKGRFELAGKEYQLTINEGENHLHGGRMGFDKVLWEAAVLADTAEPTLELTCVSPDGEEGYPGKVTLTVTYSLSDDSELRILYRGTTDRATILNPTHHSYFNLSGVFTNTILGHILGIESDAITEVDKNLITTGAYLPVDKTPFDFRIPKAIGTDINEKHEQLIFGKGYDHNWVLRNYDGQVRQAAELYEPQSGRLMTLYTDQPGLQFYSGNFLDGTAKGKTAAPQCRTGLCLEAQGYPDSPNKPHFPSVILNPGEVYRQTSIYRFSTK